MYAEDTKKPLYFLLFYKFYFFILELAFVY